MYSKISIPNPCSENYNLMPSTEQGVFCRKCSTEIIDFDSKSEQEIIAYFKQNKGKRICGKITKKDRSTSFLLKWFAIAASFFVFFLQSKKAKALNYFNTQSDTNLIDKNTQIIIFSGKVLEKPSKKFPLDKKNNKKPIPFATVTLYLDGKQVEITQTNFDGNFTMRVDYQKDKNYDLIISFVGTKELVINDVNLLKRDNIYHLTTDDDSIIIGQPIQPIIDIANPSIERNISSEDINRMPY